VAAFDALTVKGSTLPDAFVLTHPPCENIPVQVDINSRNDGVLAAAELFFHILDELTTTVILYPHQPSGVRVHVVVISLS
jgi:hypothetical protein